MSEPDPRELARHRMLVEQATAEVRDTMPAVERMTDADLVDRIEAEAVGLRIAEQRGEAEQCHDRARRIAAMAIEYMARGLA